MPDRKFPKPEPLNGFPVVPVTPELHEEFMRPGALEIGEAKTVDTKEEFFKMQVRQVREDNLVEEGAFEELTLKVGLKPDHEIDFHKVEGGFSINASKNGFVRFADKQKLIMYLISQMEE